MLHRIDAIFKKNHLTLNFNRQEARHFTVKNLWPCVTIDPCLQVISSESYRFSRSKITLFKCYKKMIKTDNFKIKACYLVTNCALKLYLFNCKQKYCISDFNWCNEGCYSQFSSATDRVNQVRWFHISLSTATMLIFAQRALVLSSTFIKSAAFSATYFFCYLCFSLITFTPRGNREAATT